jgi:hypothetical protein
MANLFIPAIGDRITIMKPWLFKLYLERRNHNFAETEGHTIVPSNHSWNVYRRNVYGSNGMLATVNHTITPGTVLECDRIYIKTTSKSAKTDEDSYDSITWKVILNGKAVRNKRFWVKLTDCYNLEFDETSVSRYRDRQ